MRLKQVVRDQTKATGMQHKKKKEKKMIIQKCQKKECNEKKKNLYFVHAPIFSTFVESHFSRPTLSASASHSLLKGLQMELILTYQWAVSYVPIRYLGIQLISENKSIILQKTIGYDQKHIRLYQIQPFSKPTLTKCQA